MGVSCHFVIEQQETGFATENLSSGANQVVGLCCRLAAPLGQHSMSAVRWSDPSLGPTASLVQLSAHRLRHALGCGLASWPTAGCAAGAQSTSKAGMLRLPYPVTSGITHLLCCNSFHIDNRFL